jgi:hypothetical protein
MGRERRAHLLSYSLCLSAMPTLPVRAEGSGFWVKVLVSHLLTYSTCLPKPCPVVHLLREKEERETRERGEREGRERGRERESDGVGRRELSLQHNPLTLTD